MSDSELDALIKWSDSILFDSSALDFVLRFSNQSLVRLDSFSFYFPSADTGSAPSCSLCVFIYLCNCHKKILKYSTANTLPPPETSESPEKQSQDTRRLPEQTSHHGERPTGVLPTCRAPGCQSAHITSSIHQCLVAFVLPVSLSPPVSLASQKLRSFHNL